MLIAMPHSRPWRASKGIYTVMAQGMDLLTPGKAKADKLAAALAVIDDFLPCPTPDAWIDAALDNLAILLVDHANCEKKAASTALSLIYRYNDRFDLLDKMSRLAREELRHFEQVIQLMRRREIAYVHISACDYAGELRKLVATSEPLKLVDTLIISAFIEARSCERFAKLAPHLDQELESFYLSLLKSEARHYSDYLKLARQYAEADISQRIARVAERERALITTPGREFRFHSGPPN